MRHTTYLFLLLWLTTPLFSMGQAVVDDAEAEAAATVDAFLHTLNLEARSSDSVLFVESHIVPRGQTDTLIMRRWAGQQHRRRIEVWYEGRLQMCLFSDGHTYFESYQRDEGWRSINDEKYYDEEQAYNIFGPLYQWQLRGEDLRYEGTAYLNDKPVVRISARSPSHYDRHYYFEKESKLMFLYTESDSIAGEALPLRTRNRVDWHAYHEYQPLGEILLPSAESYQYKNSITLIFHKARYVANDDRLFTERQIP